MGDLTKQKRYRNKKYLKAARGQPCTLRFKWCDDGGPDHESCVMCHDPLAMSGGAMKSDDDNVAIGCFNCHRILDSRDLTREEKGVYSESDRIDIFGFGKVLTHNILKQMGLMK